MPDSFLSRWSRKKAGKLEESVESKKELDPPVQKVSAPNEPELPAATLEDVEKIDPLAPDFSAFMKSDVDPTVQQAALKKMFSDPHFNVMDGLDIYIDDYSKPDPLPAGMLQRMVQSQMLKLFSGQKDGDQPLESNESSPKVDIAAIEHAQPNAILAPDLSATEKLRNMDNAVEQANQKKQSSENKQ